MESFLKSYDDIDVVICENDNEAFGAIDAIKAAGKTCGPEGDIIVVSFDSVKAAFESMIAGDLNATFECNPLHGPRVAEIIQKLEKGEEVEKIRVRRRSILRYKHGSGRNLKDKSLLIRF